MKKEKKAEVARVIDEKFMRRPGLSWKHCGWTKYRVIYKYTESLNYIISKVGRGAAAEQRCQPLARSLTGF